MDEPDITGVLIKIDHLSPDQISMNEVLAREVRRILDVDDYDDPDGYRDVVSAFTNRI